MKLGCKFWIAFRVAVLRRGFGSMRPLSLSLLFQ